MKYRTITSYKFLLLIFDLPIFFSVMLFIDVVFIDPFDWVNIWAPFLCGSCISSLIWALCFPGAFRLVTLDDDGIYCKHIALRWENVNYIGTTEIEFLKYSLLPTIRIPLIYISKDQNACTIATSPSKCILIAMNKKNINRLQSHAKGKSVAIDEFLQHL